MSPGPAEADGSMRVSGMLRRLRRTADMSQREMAAASGIARSTLAAAESGTRGLGAAALLRAAAVAGLRLVLVDDTGVEVTPMDDRAVRDAADRRYPAHLDTRLSEEGWWHGPERYSRREPWYTFDRDRRVRDGVRERRGVPADHRLPEPGDCPEERRAERRRAARRRWAEEVAHRLRTGAMPPVEPWVCDCAPACAELEDWAGPPKHAEGCPCGCDLC